MSDRLGLKKIEFENSTWWELTIPQPDGYETWNRTQKKIFYDWIREYCPSYISTFSEYGPEGNILKIAIKDPTDAAIINLRWG